MNYLQRTRWFMHGLLFGLSIVWIFSLPNNSFLIFVPGIFICIAWALTGLFGLIDLLNFLEIHWDFIWNTKQDILNTKGDK